jgi:hypothetical protein
MNDMKDIAGAIDNLANAITPSKAIPGRDAAGVHVESLIEAMMGITAALIEIAEAIREHGEK